MYCIHCGTKNSEDSRFCTGCTVSIGNTDSNSIKSATTTGINTNNIKPENIKPEYVVRKKTPIIVFIIIGLFTFIPQS